MPDLKVPAPLSRKTTNVQYLNAIRNRASSQYQARVPAATKANIQQNVQSMLSYSPTRNEFMDGLINLIGLQVVLRNSWTNPLAKFKRGMLGLGDTIEEIAIGLATAYTYDASRDYLERHLFGQDVPDVQVRYHKISRQEFYKITINDDVLKRAFLSESGLSDFVTQLMAVPSNSDNLDEFLQTTALFREYYDAGGFFVVNVPDVAAATSGEREAKTLLRNIRGIAAGLPFMSTAYNAARMPVYANLDDLEIFVTPKVAAALDVEALANLFNVERADVPARMTVIPEENFRIPGVQAILTTRDFFIIADTLLETREQSNSAGLYSNFFLHHHSIISASTFVPAILFSSVDASSEIVEEITPVDDIAPLVIRNDAGAVVTTVKRGVLFDVRGSAITDPEGGVNDAVRLSLTGNNDPATYVTNSGTLHVSPFETATSITIRATSTDDTTFSETTAVAIDADPAAVVLWPHPKPTPADPGASNVQSFGEPDAQ